MQKWHRRPTRQAAFDIVRNTRPCLGRGARIHYGGLLLAIGLLVRTGRQAAMQMQDSLNAWRSLVGVITPQRSSWTYGYLLVCCPNTGTPLSNNLRFNTYEYPEAANGLGAEYYYTHTHHTDCVKRERERESALSGLLIPKSYTSTFACFKAPNWGFGAEAATGYPNVVWGL
jgi:hypothetical protein